VWAQSRGGGRQVLSFLRQRDQNQRWRRCRLQQPGHQLPEQGWSRGTQRVCFCLLGAMLAIVVLILYVLTNDQAVALTRVLVFVVKPESSCSAWFVLLWLAGSLPPLETLTVGFMVRTQRRSSYWTTPTQRSIPLASTWIDSRWLPTARMNTKLLVLVQYSPSSRVIAFSACDLSTRRFKAHWPLQLVVLVHSQSGANCK